jgi:hypothetical protein
VLTRGGCLGQEVCRSHPRFERTEGVFDGLPTQSRGLRRAVQALLHRLENVFVLPTGDSPIFAAAAPEGPDVFVRPHEIGIAPADGSRGGLAATVAHIGFAGSVVKVELRVGDARRTLDVVLQELEYRHLALKVSQRVVVYLRDRQPAGHAVVQASLRGL